MVDLGRREHAPRSHIRRRATLIGVMALSGLWVLTAPQLGSADPVPGYDDDAHYSVPFVPALSGAFSLEGGLGDAWALSDEAIDALPNLDVNLALGYRAFLDPHGAFGLLTQLRGSHSVGDGERGAQRGVGARVGLCLRGYTPQFLYGSLGFLVGAEAVRWVDVPSDDAARYLSRDDAWGARVGGGLETSIGMLWHLRPYIFGEFAAQIWLDRLWLGNIDALHVSALWVLRLEWGLRAEDESDRDMGRLYESPREGASP